MRALGSCKAHGSKPGGELVSTSASWVSVEILINAPPSCAGRSTEAAYPLTGASLEACAGQSIDYYS